ncbi:MAG: 16S rRNA (cytosine(1402)-N(4))-methyltransferase RsmH [Anaerolineales bacterium]|nr:16S rRNA (cytosine(1402)-N(4))-methyltransferase RsmH [Anaerolineales bacterium]
MSETWPHQPVLYHEIIHALQPRRGGFYIDGTVGMGGHAWGILDASKPDGYLLGMDLDLQALAVARRRLVDFGERVILVHGSYITLAAQAAALGWSGVDGVLIDLGLSSLQLDTPERGFSFSSDAPLDMRFDQSQPRTAADLVNQLPENELADILYQYGEERRAYQVARAIVQARPLETTQQLAKVVARATRSGREGMHPATRTFQALRIAVNRELDSVQQVLPLAVSVLRPGGRLAVISFHSLEDRLVKQFMRQESRDCLCPPRQPVCTCGHRAALSEITRHPIQPGEPEIQQNVRARSAKLRVAEKLPELAR